MCVYRERLFIQEGANKVVLWWMPEVAGITFLSVKHSLHTRERSAITQRKIPHGCPYDLPDGILETQTEHAILYGINGFFRFKPLKTRGQ